MPTKYRTIADNNDVVLQYQVVYQILFWKVIRWYKIPCMNFYYGALFAHTKYITRDTIKYFSITTRLDIIGVNSIQQFVEYFPDIEDYFKWTKKRTITNLN